MNEAIDEYRRMQAANKAIPRDEFLRRFKARMVGRMGEKFDDGTSIPEYANEVGPTYYINEDQRSDGPEECADADISYWGE